MSGASSTRIYVKVAEGVHIYRSLDGSVIDVFNSRSKSLFVKLGPDASPSSFTTKLDPFEHWGVGAFIDYTGPVSTCEEPEPPYDWASEWSDE